MTMAATMGPFTEGCRLLMYAQQAQRRGVLPCSSQHLCSAGAAVSTSSMCATVVLLLHVCTQSTIHLSRR